MKRLPLARFRHSLTIGKGLVIGSLGFHSWLGNLLSPISIGRCKVRLAHQLSGGQKQRVAVARSLVGNPEVVFADEPTAALDKESGHKVIGLLRRLADERQTTIFMVTHDHRVLDYADRIIKMEDGRVVEEKSILFSGMESANQCHGSTLIRHRQVYLLILLGLIKGMDRQ